MIGPADSYVSGPQLPAHQWENGAFCAIPTPGVPTIPAGPAERWTPEQWAAFNAQADQAKRDWWATLPHGQREEHREKERQLAEWTAARVNADHWAEYHRKCRETAEWKARGGPVQFLAPDECLPANDPALSGLAEVEAELQSMYEERRASDYLEHTVNLSGHVLDPDTFRASLARRWQRYQDTVDLANALEKAGVPANYSKRGGRPIPWIVCPISRTAIRLPIIRRVNFFPETAAARRSPMLKEVEHYLQQNPWARMATFTAGQRVPTPQIRRTHKALTRKLSRMAAEPWFKVRAEIVFRAVEYGTPELSAVLGDWTWHVHTHTVFRPHKALAKKAWRKFCRRVSRYMGARWDAGRPVENPRELVKYPVKPADLKTLLEIGGPEAVRAFFEQTLKLRICETLGTLRAQRRELRVTKRRRHREKTRSGKWVSTVRHNWNQRGREIRADEEKAKREASERRRQNLLNRGLTPACRTCLISLRRQHDPEGAPAMLNRIVARLSPAPYAARVYEPAAYVWNFDGNFDAIAQHRAIRPALDAVAGFTSYQLATAAHFDRLSAQDRAAVHNRSHQSRNCPADQLTLPDVKPPPDPSRWHLLALAG